MGRGTTIELAGVRFPSKKSAYEFFQRIQERAIQENKLGQPITNEREIAVISAVLAIKDDSKNKKGSGVDYFFVDRLRNHPEAHGRFNVGADDVSIWIMREDGTPVDCGWRQIIEEYDQNLSVRHMKLVKSALRDAIEPLRIKYREESFKKQGQIICPKSGKLMTNYHQAKVIYEFPSWGELTGMFAAKEGGWENIDLAEPSDEVRFGRKLRDSVVERRWIAFWQEHARPQIVSK